MVVFLSNFHNYASVNSSCAAPGAGHLPTPTGKNNRFPFLDILGYSKKTRKNPKFGNVRQVPTREFLAKLPDWDLSHLPNLGFLWVFFKYPKISKNGNRLFFPVTGANPKLLTCTQFPIRI